MSLSEQNLTLELDDAKAALEDMTASRDMFQKATAKDAWEIHQLRHELFRAQKSCDAFAIFSARSAQVLADAIQGAQVRASTAERERDEAVALISQLRAEGQAAREALQQLERQDLVGPLYFTKVNDLRRTTGALLVRLEGK
jgi:predicted  nucleic acid-binding Zn-ribbon protein